MTAAWMSVPWREADHRKHPPERHNCRCSCEAMTDRLCPEHGQVVPGACDADFPASWLVAAAVAIGDGKAEPEDLRAAARVLAALRCEGALRRIAQPIAEGAA